MKRRSPLEPDKDKVGIHFTGDHFQALHRARILTNARSYKHAAVAAVRRLEAEAHATAVNGEHATPAAPHLIAAGSVLRDDGHDALAELTGLLIALLKRSQDDRDNGAERAGIVKQAMVEAIELGRSKQASLEVQA